MPMCRCSRASGAGAHQLTRPSTFMNAGTNNIRTIVASIRTANGTPRPNIRMTDTFAAINDANVMAISSAAAVTTRPVWAKPIATLSSLSALVFPDSSQYSRMREIRNTS